MWSNSSLTIKLEQLGQPLIFDQRRDGALTFYFSHPTPFQVDIIPRSAETTKLVHRVVEAGIRD